MENANVNPIPPDPLIDEIRAIRAEIAQQFDNDVDKLCDHLQELERQHPDRILSKPVANTQKPT